MDNLLSVVLVSLLFAVFLWFFWPLLADALARRVGQKNFDDKSTNDDDLFEVWAKRAARLN